MHFFKNFSDFQHKPIPSRSLEGAEEMEQTCESCKKILDKSKLLKHIGNSKACKAYYGSRYLELKANKRCETKLKYWNSLPRKRIEKINKDRREKYSNDPEKQAMKKLIYQERKEKKLIPLIFFYFKYQVSIS